MLCLCSPSLLPFTLGTPHLPGDLSLFSGSFFSSLFFYSVPHFFSSAPFFF
ncbi:mCG1028354 [Mus musculus]|nr:mCG1028354 [Mus musculus]